jgi:hypothetical protein
LIAKTVVLSGVTGKRSDDPLGKTGARRISVSVGVHLGGG